MNHDLNGLIRVHGGELSESHIKCYLRQLLEAISDCHKHNVFHRDIKCSFFISSYFLLYYETANNYFH